MRLQDAVAQVLRDYDMSHDVYIRIIDAMSELGEVSNDLLRETDFGRQAPDSMSFLHDELGDVFFSLLALAHVCDVDLEQAIKDAIAKYDRRYTEHGDVSSGE